MAKPNGTAAEDASEMPPIIDIAPLGDLVLQINHPSAATGMDTHSFRVSISVLRSKSDYFDRLLDPSGRFGEGSQVASSHATLLKSHASLSVVPSSSLPCIPISDLGRISPVKSLSALLTDFLLILHDRDPNNTAPPVANLANLAIVADRFTALSPIRHWTTRKKVLHLLETKTLPRTELALPEERCRQRLLVALLLDHPPWTERYSLRLITKGWTTPPDSDVDVSEEPLWWDLPGRVEEELHCRRSAILATLQDLQSHFLSLYASRARQCRLGYDSSPECDSFQFGEMVRFFVRAGTLSLSSSILPSSERSPSYKGDVWILLDRLKNVPEYQVDRNHRHCGIRTRFVPLLDFLSGAIQLAGICGECWGKREDRWIESKGPLTWKKAGIGFRGKEHGRRHEGVRDVFLAGGRVWE